MSGAQAASRQGIPNSNTPLSSADQHGPRGDLRSCGDGAQGAPWRTPEPVFVLPRPRGAGRRGWAAPGFVDGPCCPGHGGLSLWTCPVSPAPLPPATSPGAPAALRAWALRTPAACVLAADADAFNLLLEMKLKRRRERPRLPRTVTELVAEDGSRVYVVGTAHFSDDSKKDVVKVTATALGLPRPLSQGRQPVLSALSLIA